MPPIHNKQLEPQARKLPASASVPSTLTGEGAWYVKIVSGIAEGFYADDQGNEIQITDNGSVLGGGGGGAVASVNTQTGAVVLDADDISDAATTNKWATATELAKLAGIDALAEVNPDLVTQVDAEAGTSAVEKSWSPFRVKQAIVALTPGGGGGEANDIINLGGGSEIFKNKVGVNFNFRTILVGTGLVKSQATDTITLQMSANISNLVDVDTVTTAPAPGEVLTFNGTSNKWEPAAAAGGGGAAVVAANINIPTGASLSVRIAAATGLPAGWSVVLGNDAAVDAGLTTIGAGAVDIVIKHDSGKSPASIKVMKDFGGLVRQQVTYDPSTGDVLEDNAYNQILLKDPENGTKAGTAEFQIIIVVPA